MHESIQHKVEYIKAYVRFILKEDVFKEQKKQEEKKEVPCLKYSDEEIKNQGKRLVDKDFEEVTEVQTPNKVVEQMLDILPASIWNPNTKFLDPACKSGEYLKAIFNRLMASNLYPKEVYPNDVIKTLHIISEQLYGIALSDASYENTLKNLSKKANIVKINDFQEIIKAYSTIDKPNSKAILARLNITEKTIKEFISHKFKEENMKFDIVIGNPPYQQGPKSIYNDFIDAAISLEPKYITMIVKNNWLNSDTLKSTRKI